MSVAYCYDAGMTDGATSPGVRITVGGQLAWTVPMAAERLGMEPATVRSIIHRDQISHAAVLDGARKLYLASALRAAIAARPGKGRRRAP